MALPESGVFLFHRNVLWRFSDRRDSFQSADRKAETICGRKYSDSCLRGNQGSHPGCTGKSGIQIPFLCALPLGESLGRAPEGNGNTFRETEKTKKIIGAEVLSRLNSESEGVLTPGSFLSAVDSVGINDKFDYYIFEKNCKWISNNKEQRENYVYTINFSRTTLCDPLFAKNIIDTIEKYNLKYESLAIEILEDKNVTGNSREYMKNNLLALKEKGISILLDDFGSGFTAFGDLQSFAIDTVKVDKSIIKNSNTETGFAILKNIIQTAKDIGLKTVCEGIETKEEERVAVEVGCDMLQGYYYYRPMKVSQLEGLFDSGIERV